MASAETYFLGPDEWHSYQVSNDLICVHGEPEVETTLKRGGAYAFRAPLDPTGPIALTALSTARPNKTESTHAAEKAKLQEELAGLNATLVRLQEDLTAARARETQQRNEIARLTADSTSLQEMLEAANARLRKTIARTENRASARPIQLSCDKQTIDLGTIDVLRGCAEQVLTVPLKHDATSPIPLRVAADFHIPRGSVRVQPEIAQVSPEQQLEVKLLFDNVSSGGDFAGQLMLFGTRELEHLRVTIPITARLNPKLAELSSDGEVLSIITWPRGAETYISDLSSKQPWCREWLGTTPIQCRVPAGRYQLLIIPPTTEDGYWAAPDGTVSTIGFGEKAIESFSIDVAKADNVPALVRALWLCASGPNSDRLTQATEGAPELFAPPPFEEFLVFCTRALARARIAVNTEDARKLYDVIRKSGWLRYELDGGTTAIDLSFDAGAPEPFTFKAVRLPTKVRQ